MSSIYLYIIYISRPWFKGSGAAAGSGSISDIHSLMPLLPLCYSTHKSSFCEEEREYSDGHPSHFLLQLVGKTDACQRVLIKNTPDVVRRPACFVVKGVQGSGLWVQGSGLWWRLRRKYLWGDARRSVDRRFSSYRQPSPRGEGAPKGRIGYWRHERQKKEDVTWSPDPRPYFTYLASSSTVTSFRKP